MLFRRNLSNNFFADLERKTLQRYLYKGGVSADGYYYASVCFPDSETSIGQQWTVVSGYSC